MFLFFSNLLNQLKETILRFPIVTAFTTQATVIALVLIEMDYPPNADYSYLYNLLITSILGAVLFISFRLVNERYIVKNFLQNLFTNKNNLIREGIQVCLLVFLLFYFLLLPDNWSLMFGVDVLRIFLLTLAFTLVITFAPYIKSDEENGFWQYNKTLFLRTFFAKLYGIILFIGLMLALVAIQQIFDIHIDEKIYPELYVFIIGILAVQFFLAGIPKDFKKLNKEISYPKGIKFFTQFILIPLMIVYTFILTAYLIKIIIIQQWPEGMIAWLILLFSAIGMIAYVLVHPLKKDNIFAQYFSKIFFSLNTIFIIALFMTIAIRINAYGLTEARYYVVLIGIWLTAMSLYFLFSKKQDLRILPVSLFIFILGSSLGPWGAISMSENNQFQQLKNILVKEKILVNNKITKQENLDLSKDHLRSISNILEYLTDRHGYQKLQTWFDQDLRKYLEEQKNKKKKDRLDDQQCWNNACYIMQLMELQYINRWDYKDINNPERNYFDFNLQQEDDIYNVSNYDLLTMHYISEYNSYKTDFQHQKQNYNIRYSLKNKSLIFSQEDNVLYNLDMNQFIQHLHNNYNGIYNEKIKMQDLTLISDDQKLKIIFKNISTNKTNDTFKVESLDLILFLKN